MSGDWRNWKTRIECTRLANYPVLNFREGEAPAEPPFCWSHKKLGNSFALALSINRLLFQEGMRKMAEQLITPTTVPTMRMTHLTTEQRELLPLAFGQFRVAQLKGERPEAPASRTPMPDVSTLDELESVIAEIARQEDERIKATVRDLLEDRLSLSRDEATAGVAIETVESPRFTGQVIRDGERIVYASLPTTQQWFNDSKWRNAPPFSI